MKHSCKKNQEPFTDELTYDLKDALKLIIRMDRNSEEERKEFHKQLVQQQKTFELQLDSQSKQMDKLIRAFESHL